jgi:membrane protein implicated in regulation of membrane protease activity
MLNFLLSADNVLFMAALLLMLLIGIVEALGFGGGWALGQGLDGADGDLNVETPSLLSWINIGRLPLLMLIVVFLFSFGVAGLVGQRLLFGLTGLTAPWILAVPLAFAAALPFTRFFGRVVARIMPGDETTAVSRESLVGRVAVIVTGEARPASAAQARVRDAFGQVHYVMVEPDNAQDVFVEGASVLIVRHAGAKFFAIHNSSASLRDANV